ncbi:cell division protein FtsL [Fervidibacillus halotolerans]|uniref:Cell division protein FtsL n=1 Tax=Fervidibacillus halotolerans TaxID=2980027 RepID=A0A9E8M3F2_9BACI|nr:cell division protein FtsL [Fervidibacillus halotolerans]WAA13689.1 cell division protein FtsL [Fervidibacillus halotolerans]
MSNLARKLQRQDVYSPQIDKRVVKKRKKITKGEKFLYGLMVVVLCFLSVKIIATQASLYQVNKNIQLTQAQMDEQEKVLQDLQSQVNELKDYRRLAKEAEKLGLKMDENNIKSVHTP